MFAQRTRLASPPPRAEAPATVLDALQAARACLAGSPPFTVPFAGRAIPVRSTALAAELARALVSDAAEIDSTLRDLATAPLTLAALDAAIDVLRGATALVESNDA